MRQRGGAILPYNEFIGHDGRHYLDLAVDSSCISAVPWLRRCQEDGKYLLVVSVVVGQVLKKELSLGEARELYYALPDRLPVGQAFPKQSTAKKSG